MVDAPAAAQDELRLELSGGARLSGSGFSVDRLERKTAALLAYVALEKHATRKDIASLLWPEAAPATARNNLAQVIARVKKIAGRVVVQGKDALALDRVRVDVAELELDVQRGRVEKAKQAKHGQLLAGYDFADCPELAEWLDWRRDQLRRTALRALELEARKLEAERDFAGAVERMEEALEIDRLGEVVYRRLMRLHIARGDRARALDVFAQCERVLAEELAISPSRDTVALADRLRRESSSPPAAEDDRAPSLRFDHPRFVGRAAARAIAERARAAGSTVLVSGDPGIGKTRFMLEIAQDDGPHLLIEGRPGDASVPFSTLARCLRQLIRSRAPTLPGWARLELSRILPELRSEGTALGGEAERMRLFDAAFELFQHTRAGTQCIVLDDLQYFDTASVEAFDHLLTRYQSESEPEARTLIGFRRGELGGAVLGWVDRTIESGRGALIELQGLESDAIWELAESLTEDARGLVPDLERASLGNPLFISELLRNAAAGASASRLTPRIERALERRLERLSAGALQLARVLAILGSEIDVELAARVMERQPLDLDRAWAELERENVLTGGRFAHDLLAESLERSLSRGLLVYLHKRAAQELEKKGASAAVVARHYILGEDSLAAAPFLVRAGERLRTLSRLEEAVTEFERAGDIFIEHADARSAIGAWFAAGRILRAVDRGGRFQRLVDRMTTHSRSDGERARALVVQAFFDESSDDLESAATHATAALELATRLGHTVPRADALRSLFTTRLRQGRLGDAETALSEFAAMCSASGQPEAEVAALWHAAELLAARDLHLRAIELYRKANEIVERVGGFGYVRVAMQGLIAHSELALGRTHAVRSTLETDRITPDIPPTFRLRLELCQVRIDVALGRFQSAEERLTRLLAAAPNWLWESRARYVRGSLSIWLGARTLGKNELMIVIDDERTDAATRIDAMMALARVSGGMLSAEQRAFVDHGASPLQRLALLAMQAEPASVEELESALAEAEALGARGHTIALSLALAEALMRRGACDRSLGLVNSAWEQAQAEPPGFPELARVALARAELATAAGVDAESAWADAERVLDAAEIPTERQQSYASDCPVVRRIRARASSEWLRDAPRTIQSSSEGLRRP